MIGTPEEHTVADATTIVIAEDNSVSRDALRALLEAYGFSVVEAANGQEALSQVSEGKGDLVLMDIMMPIMDGLEATRRIRQLPGGSDIPILALTAMAGSRQLAIDAGCDDCLTKPVDIPFFLKTIRKWISQRDSKSGSAA